ncbi:MAG: TULIP family P47-like protein, partial [Pseudomonadota bacterium]
THVFAAINISQQMSEETEGEAFVWLKPTEVSYAFGASRVDPDASILAILCQTQGRSSSGLVHQADPGLIPPNCDAGVVISRSRFLRNMIGEALPRAFEGLKLSDVKYKEKDTGLTLAKKVKTAKVKHDKKTYQPVIHELDITLRDAEMDLRSLTKTEVSPGIFSVCSASAGYAFGLMDRKSGGKTIGFVETRKMKTVESTEKTKAVKILDNVLMAIAAVGALVVTLASWGTLTVPYYVLTAILVGTVAAGLGSATIKAIELAKNGDAPPIDLLMANATGAVRWSSGRTFDPTFAALNNGLQIGGTFVGADTGLMSATPVTGPAYQTTFQADFAEIMKERKDQ